MFVPHSQAEFKRLFLQGAYTTHSGFGSARPNYASNSICSSFNPNGQQGQQTSSKFWMGLWRKGLTSDTNTRSTDSSNQREFNTDDPWFINDYRSNQGCIRQDRKETLYSTFHSDEADYQRQDCQGEKTNGDTIYNDDYNEEGENCWSGQRHPSRYQNFANRHINSVNALKGGNGDVFQDDCVVAHCSDNNEQVSFENVQCNDIHHVPVCRVPLVSCKNKLKCEAKEDLLEYITKSPAGATNAPYTDIPQLCGKVSLQSNAIDYVAGFESTRSLF